MMTAIAAGPTLPRQAAQAPASGEMAPAASAPVDRVALGEAPTSTQTPRSYEFVPITVVMDRAPLRARLWSALEGTIKGAIYTGAPLLWLHATQAALTHGHPLLALAAGANGVLGGLMSLGVGVNLGSLLAESAAGRTTLATGLGVAAAGALAVSALGASPLATAVVASACGFGSVGLRSPAAYWESL